MEPAASALLLCPRPMATPPNQRARSRWLAPALIAAGLFVGLGVVEFLLRAFPPMPPSQIIRSQAMRWGQVRLLNGVPVWGDDARANRDCLKQHPERPTLFFFGDSITFGTGIEDSEVFTTLLEHRLGDRFCVLNFAQPAYGFDQSFETARVELAGKHPAIVFWQLWNEQRAYAVLGDNAFNLAGRRLHEDGFPYPRFASALPAAVNRFLFLHSRLYELTTLAYPEMLPPLPPREATAKIAAENLARIPPLVKATGARLVFFLGTPLDKPFPELRTDRRHEDLEEAVAILARTQGAEALRLQDLLADQDVAAVRLDTCCHYNAKGHEALAAAFEKVVTKALPPAP